MAAVNEAPHMMTDAAGITAELRRGGSGAPLLVIHGEFGVPGWLESFAQLAEHYDVIVPSSTSWFSSARWASSPSAARSSTISWKAD